jgi:soluble lytic murein transglycosylase-like protein
MGHGRGRLFAPREVIIRHDGRVRCVVLSARDQLRLVALAVFGPALLIAVCGGLLYAQRDVPSQPITLLEPTAPDPHYSALAREMRAMLAPRVAVSVQAGSSDAVWLTAALRALDAERRSRSQSIEILQRKTRQLHAAVVRLRAKGDHIAAAVGRSQAGLRAIEAEREAEVVRSVRLAETLRATQAKLASSATTRAALERGAGILNSGLQAAQEIGLHLERVRRGYAAHLDEIAAMLDTSRDAGDRLAARLESARQELAMAAGPRLAAIAQKRGVDLIDYLFPMRDLPPADAPTLVSAGAEDDLAAVQASVDAPRSDATDPDPPDLDAPDAAAPSAGGLPVADGDDGPETALVLAVMRQESGFAHKAVNASGATGLMQLMPDTAQEVADKLNLGYDDDKLLDPAFNVTLGRAYLRDLIRYYDGSYILALAAYNAGPSRVGEWIKRFGDPRLAPEDPLDWVEQIPFRETRRYVSAVMCALQVYRYRLDDPDRMRGPRPPAIRVIADRAPD